MLVRKFLYANGYHHKPQIKTSLANRKMIFSVQPKRLLQCENMED